MKYFKVLFILLMVGSLTTEMLPLSAKSFVAEEGELILEMIHMVGGRRPKGTFEPIEVISSSSQIKINIIFDEKLNIKVTSSNGVTMYSKQYSNIDTYEQLQISTTAWASGTYTVTFETLDGSYKSGCSFTK